ncbi:MAG: site-specific DNA-methyltransferase [Planctomycetes bacterium]|nr:site-specific DNA-methyltransferase [Planctomycetota bacterium]
MKKLTPDDPETRSPDIAAENLARLKALFPEIVTEGPKGASINVDVLKSLVGDSTVTDAEEKYGLNWHGKRKARRLALMPSTGTLRPCPEESVDWDTTKNLMIEGDNLEVLKLLQKSYAGRVKLIYIDPPYNTGRDLLYPNDYSDGVATYLEVTGQTTGGASLSTNTESSGRFHTTWLSMMYSRLKCARSLLRSDGVLICTIDDNEHATLGVLLRDVFEEGTYDHVCVTIVHNPRGIQGTNFSYSHEYAYFVLPRGAKSIVDRRIAPEDIDWAHFRNWGTESERTDARNCFYPVLVRDGKVVGFGDVCRDDFHPRQTEEINGVSHVYPIDRGGVERKWRYARQSADSVRHLLRARKVDYGYEIELGKDFGAYRTVWTDRRYDANEYGTKVLRALLPDSPFTFPKSIWAVYDCIQAVTGEAKDSIIMDFFAGSGTTGHAVMEINKDDGGTRRFVVVQLPERVSDAGRYRTIADVTKARLREAGRTLASANPMFRGDLGFRVFKLDSTNIQEWQPKRDDLDDSLLSTVDHLKSNRTEADVLYELLLKLGLDLCVPIEVKEIAKMTVHSIGGGVLMACLSEKIGREDVEALGQGIVEWRNALAPAGDTTCVFRDAAFADDVAKTNLALILEQNGIKKVRSL